MIVPENKDIYELASIIHTNLEHSRLHNFHYFHLADYADVHNNNLTHIWCASPSFITQDEAVLKEFAQFELPPDDELNEFTMEQKGISFGVASYALYPGQRFATSSSGIDCTIQVDYNSLQQQILSNSKRLGKKFLLSHNQGEISKMFQIKYIKK